MKQRPILFHTAICLLMAIFTSCSNPIDTPKNEPQEITFINGAPKFQIYIRDSGDTTINGDMELAIKYLLVEQGKLFDQRDAMQDILNSLKCAVQPNDSLYAEYLIAREKYFNLMGWEMTEIKCN